MAYLEKPFQVKRLDKGLKSVRGKEDIIATVSKAKAKSTATKPRGKKAAPVDAVDEELDDSDDIDVTEIVAEATQAVDLTTDDVKVEDTDDSEPQTESIQLPTGDSWRADHP